MNDSMSKALSDITWRAKCLGLLLSKSRDQAQSLHPGDVLVLKLVRDGREYLLLKEEIEAALHILCASTTLCPPRVVGKNATVTNDDHLTVSAIDQCSLNDGASLIQGYNFRLDMVARLRRSQNRQAAKTFVAAARSFVNAVIIQGSEYNASIAALDDMDNALLTMPTSD